MKPALAAVLVLIAGTSGAQTPDPMNAPTLRVCADPDGLPFSNRAGEGFHNRIAELLAQALGRELDYAWYPYGIGFLRQTLLRGRCDVVMGVVRPHEDVAVTPPYMHAGYGLVAPAGTLTLDRVAIDDPRVQDLRLGVVTGSPPATHLAHTGQIGRARPYRPILDRRHGAPLAQMVSEMNAGMTDAIVMWRPLATWAVAQSDGALALTVLAEPGVAPPLVQSVGVAVRRKDVSWHRMLSVILASRAEEIQAILDEYGLDSELHEN